MTQKTLVRVNLKLTQGSHRVFKSWCARNGLTLQDGLDQAIRLMMAGGSAPTVPPAGQAVRPVVLEVEEVDSPLTEAERAVAGEAARLLGVRAS